MRLGVFGGSFNPIHIAHLRVAEEVRESLHLDRVLFVPTSDPPHKQDTVLAPAEDRMAMVRLAVRGNPYFRVSPIEIERPGRSYSIDTLTLLRRRLGERARLFFLVGLDAFLEIDTWKDYLQLFRLASFVVVSRPPGEPPQGFAAIPVAARAQFCYGDSSTVLMHESGTEIHFLNVTALEISASDLRARIARGASIRYLVPASVERYVGSRGLYAARSKIG